MSSWNFRILTIVFALIGISVTAQSQRVVDSLRELIQHTSDTTRFNNLMELIYEYGENSKNSEALIVAREANDLAVSLKDTIMLIRSGRWIGQLLHRLGRNDESLELLFAYLDLAKQDKYKIHYVRILNNVASAYLSQARYDRALDYNFQSLQERIELKDTAMIAVSLNNVGLVYYKLEDNEKAIFYYKQVIDLMNARKYDFDLADIYINLSLSHLRKGDIENARKNSAHARLVCNNDCSPNFQIDYSYVQGEIAYARNDIRSAERYLRKSYELSEKYGSSQFQIENIISLSRIYIRQKRFQLAESYLRLAIRIGSGLTYSSLLRDIYKQFSDLYIASGDSENEKKFLQKYIQFSDSLYNEKLTQNLLAVHVEHEQKANKAKIVAQNGELLLKEEVIHRQKVLTFKGNEGINKIGPLIQIVIEQSLVKNDVEALRVAKIANELATQFGDTAKIVRSRRMIGQMLSRLGRPQEAQDIVFETIPIARHLSDSILDLSKMYNTLAGTYTKQGLYDKALRYNFKSMGLNEIQGDKEAISMSYNNIGLVYYKLRNNDKAVEYYLKSLNLKRDLHLYYDLDLLLINLSLCYASKKQYTIAKGYLQQAFEVCAGNCLLSSIMAGEYAKAQIADGENIYKVAEVAYLKSYNISIQIDDKAYQAESLVSLIELYLKQGSFLKAARYLKVAEKLSKEFKFNLLQLLLWQDYAKYYNGIKDYKNSLEYQSKYIHYRDSLFSQNLTQNLMAIQTEYEQRDNKAKIAVQNKELLLKEEIIDRQKILTSVAGIAILILGLLIFVSYQTNQHKKSVNIVLEQKVIGRSKELQTSYEAIQKTYNDQRRFIHETMSDAKIQLLNIRNFSLSGLKEVNSEQVVQYIGRLNNTTDELRAIMERLTKEVNT